MTPAGLALLIQMATTREDSPARALARAHLAHIGISWALFIGGLIAAGALANFLWSAPQ